MTATTHKPVYDSFAVWLAHADDDEVAEALYHVLSERDQLEEFLEELDKLLAAHPEQ